MLTTLVARHDSLGDVLLAGPAVRAIAERSRVVMLCSPAGARAAELLDGVDDLIVHDCPWITADPSPVDPAAWARTVRRIAAVRADEAVVLTSPRQSALPTALVFRLAEVPRVGAYSRDYPGALLDVRLREDPAVHEVERNLLLAEAMGHRRADNAQLFARVPELPEPIAARLPDEFVVVHPGSTAPSRTLTPARWADVARAVAQRGGPVVVTGLADERTRAVVERCDDVVDLSGRTSFAELGAVLARARAVCVGNTGAMHLAAAVGAPVVACFPPTVPTEQWRPWQVEHVVLQDATVGCAPCYLRECVVDGQPCASIDGEQVADAVDSLMAGRSLTAAGGRR